MTTPLGSASSAIAITSFTEPVAVGALGDVAAASFE
jgi:hypothetical protein